MKKGGALSSTKLDTVIAVTLMTCLEDILIGFEVAVIGTVRPLKTRFCEAGITSRIGFTPEIAFSVT